MANNQFINLEELSKTTQALLSKINEQSNLKVNKANVNAEYSEGTKIGSIEGTDFYTPEIDTSNFITRDDDLGLAQVAYSGSYKDLTNKPAIPSSDNFIQLNKYPILVFQGQSLQELQCIQFPTFTINESISKSFYSYAYFKDPVRTTNTSQTTIIINSNTYTIHFCGQNSSPYLYSWEAGIYYCTIRMGDDGNHIYIYHSTLANNALLVSGHTVASNVPANAVFTDTVYDDTAISSRITTLENAGYITSYTETDPTVPSWAKAESKPTYTASEVGAASTSDLNDYVKKISEKDGNGYTISQSVGRYGGVLSFSAYGDYAAGLSISGNAGSVSITGKLIVPTPTNDTHAATKKYVDDSDKLKTTASSNNTEYNLIGTETSNANIAGVSIYKQDLLSFAKTSNLSRLTIGSTSMPGVVRIYTSADSASGFTDIKSNASSTNERTITFPDASGTVALTSDIPSVPSWALANNKPSYAFSELTSHPTTLNDYGITDAYTKTEVDGLVSGVLHYKGTKANVSALPSSDNVTGDVWHITADGSEWAWDGSTWQELGTAVDLTGYLQSSDIAAWAKTANKPSYTASEVGALPSSTTYVSSFNGQSGAITYVPPVSSVNGQTGVVELTIPSDTSDLTNGAGFLTSFTETDPTVPSWAKASTKPSYTASEVGAASATHAHGSITSDGAITENTALASSDRLVFADNSDSGKLKRSTITFGSSTTQYLANNGTWQNVPSTYDDTALAARVSALEQIPWVTYYTGSTTPSNSQGNNGDLYFQTA